MTAESAVSLKFVRRGAQERSATKEAKRQREIKDFGRKVFICKRYSHSIKCHKPMKKPLGIPANTTPSSSHSSGSYSSGGRTAQRPGQMTAQELRRRGGMQAASKPEGYKEFAASELYCPKCGVAMPVREKPLLYLPTGEVSDYRCARCHTVLGTKRT